MSTDYFTYRPSKRPSVKQVQDWRVVYTDCIDNDWRGRNGCVYVYNGYPFPDFYKVVHVEAGTKKKTSKLFYGESAWNQTEMFVYDLGFTNVLGRL